MQLTSACAPLPCRARWREVKQQKKKALAERIREQTGYQVSTEPMYDIHVSCRGGGLRCWQDPCWEVHVLLGLFGVFSKDETCCKV